MDFGRWCEKESQQHTERKGKTDLRDKRGSKGWNVGKVGKWIFLLLLVPRNSGVASVASEYIIKGEEKIEGAQ